MNLENKSFLFKLLNAYSPSGYESVVTNMFAKECSKYAKYEFTDNIGNVAFSIGTGKIPFMISGHVDEIALQVQYIDDDGFIHFIKDGGVDPKTAIGRKVIIHAHNKAYGVCGVIGKTPIHVEFHTDAKDKVTKLSDLKIDVGAESREEVYKMGVRVGDPITFRHQVTVLGENRITCGSIDDKVGVYVTAQVIKRLSDNFDKKPIKMFKIYGVACTQEEVGGYGASLAAKRINPMFSIDYDVTFATDDGCVNKNEWGDIKLGKGGCVAFGPDKNNTMTKMMVDVCKSNRINYQCFSVGAGMTNTLKIKMAADDCQTMLISIPQRNMHTQVEVCDLRDLDSMVDMTCEFIYELDERLAKENVTK